LLKKQFDYTRDWAEFVSKKNTWPDADMLPLGKLRVTAKEGGGSPTKLTPDEQQTLMTLWCIFRSPLIFGGDLPSLDPVTFKLITNDEVLQVDQHSHGSHQALEEGNVRAWVASISATTRDYYIAVFNLGDETTTVSLPWSKFFVMGRTAEVRDMWAKRSLGIKAGVEIELRPHASALFRITHLQ